MLSFYQYHDVIVRKRRRLPHWHAASGLYMLTFHLADSLPAHVMADLPQNATRRRRRIEEILDRGHGSAVLAGREPIRIVRSALEFFDRKRYSLIAWSVMPNHLHTVLKLAGTHTLNGVIASLKRHTSREINELLGRRGQLWQSDYFDRLIRSPRHLERATEYVLGNPAKAGLDPEGRTGLNADAYAELM